ncbi:hypothetical protein AK830_g4416 [Neonectria ditissima]|uniref:Uncharacterized protein n=1 Tax=Neonectria ditissima TaxID=78410 RepID=A0A0P7BNU1_9HYPO|nr:hypothetical protein AK830_g4416 [Neonectria ditissima]
MDDSDAVELLKTRAWDISEVIQSLNKCPHISQAAQQHMSKEMSHICSVCLGIETNLGLISTRLESDPEAGLGGDIKQDVSGLLNVLNEMSSVSAYPFFTALEIAKNVLAEIAPISGHAKDSHKSILAYLRQPSFVVESLSGMCEKLLRRLQTSDTEDAMEIPEPEDHSHAHRALFPVLRKYSFCSTCHSRQGPQDVKTWHPTRLFLMDPVTREDDLVRFDVITASIADDSWQDLCINVSSASRKRVTFGSDDDDIDSSCCQPTLKNQERLDGFCQIFQDDYGCRISLKLEDGALFRLGVKMKKHQASPGVGLCLADVLTQYTLKVKEKLALSHAIALAFWEFYDSQLMLRAWNSHNIWFMPEPSLRDSSEGLPMRAYISFHPEVSECDFDASEFIHQNSLIHKCPRIQSLAILLIEIGLGKPFQCRSFKGPTPQLNTRYTVASQYLEELKETEWENFGHKYIFTNAVEGCLKLGGLMGKETNSDNCDSINLRRGLLYQKVLSPLQWLHSSFREPNQRASYLTAKRLVQDNHQTNEYPPSPPKETSISLPPTLIVTNPNIPPANKQVPPANRFAFEIAIICALTIESNAIESLFDRHWDDDGIGYDKATGDPNAYSTGLIGRHNVVLAHMPGMGKGSAAAVAANCRGSFPNIKLAIVVGICGAVPFTPDKKEEIILGDVIVSDGIIQYDLGRKFDERFERKDTLLDSLGRPNAEIRGLLTKLKGLHSQKTMQNKIAAYLKELQKESELKAEYPGAQHDRLFAATYSHFGDGSRCKQGRCHGELVSRHRLTTGLTQPKVHFGLMASGDTVMKSGAERDSIARQEGVLGFEMEGAGVWDAFPCVVIKGACDYADSHKTKTWQQYAAATAAACTKAFLSQWVPSLGSCE